MTRKPCPPPSELSAFAAGEPVAGIGAHVESCALCSRRLEAVRRALQANVREAAVAASADEVNALVEELLRVPARERPGHATQERYARPAIAQRFSELAVAEWERDLNIALDHIHVATVIASHLTRRVGRVGELEFETWKNRSTIHRERGEMDSARAALMHAASAVEHCADRELKRAILWYAEAAICASRDVWEPHQALTLLGRCEKVFRLRDPARGRAARMLRGIIHFHAGEHDDALKAFGAVAADTDPADKPGRADAMRNVANTLIRLRRVGEAEAILREVRRTDVALGRSLHVIRDDGLAAIAADVRGDYQSAAVGYADTQRRFAASGEMESALLMGKSRAVSLVASGRVSDACAVLRDLLATSVAIGSDRRRFTAEALAYLRRLAEREQLTLDVAASVSAYIDRIHVQRAVPFAPPMSPLTM